MYFYEMMQKKAEEKFQFIGNRFQGVGVLIPDNKGRFLVTHHKKLNLTNIPTGKIDEGESHLDAIKREMKEELGIDVLRAKYLASKDYDDPGGVYPAYTNHLYMATKIRGTPKILEPHKLSRLRFADLAKVRKPSTSISMWNEIKKIGKKTGL